MWYSLRSRFARENSRAVSLNFCSKWSFKLSRFCASTTSSARRSELSPPTCFSRNALRVCEFLHALAQLLRERLDDTVVGGGSPAASLGQRDLALQSLHPVLQQSVLPRESDILLFPRLRSPVSLRNAEFQVANLLPDPSHVLDPACPLVALLCVMCARLQVNAGRGGLRSVQPFNDKRKKVSRRQL